MQTHSELIHIGERWLRKHDQNMLVPNCPLVASDMVTANRTGEIPDIIGWCSHSSVMIEAKISRSDFLKDKNKPFRSNPSKGMGEYKLYLCPSGLIQPDEVPNSWGILWVGSNGVFIEKPATKSGCNLLAERAMLLSLHRRKINK